MNLLFVGTVEFSRRCFHAVVAAGHDPDLITMRETEGRQRHGDWVDLTPLAPGKVYYDVVPTLIRARNYDLILVCGWSRLLPLDLAPQMVGTHPTLLPRGRGRHPIPWSIILTDGAWSGLTFFRLTETPDAGPIIWQGSRYVEPNDHAAEVYNKICDLGASAIREVLRRVAANIPGTPQDERQASVWPRRVREDNHVHWDRADTVRRLVRAVSRPYPGAWSFLDPLRVEALGGEVRWWRIGPDDWEDRGLIAPPGTIQSVTKDRLVVATGDGWVAFSEWEWPEGADCRPGMRLL